MDSYSERVNKYLTALHSKHKGYPEEAKAFDSKKFEGFCTNNIIWDIDKGTLIKLYEG